MAFTTLVPAYKPQYLNELLGALLTQTVLPSRVIISDDSPDAAFLRILADPANAAVVERLHIEVVRGPCLGAWPNLQQLLRLHANRTPLLHVLLDDDIPYPNFYARHQQAHALGGSGCVVSRRWYALENGQPTRDLRVPPAIDARPERLLTLPSGVLFPLTVGMCNNWMGEFSNFTFSSAWTEALIQPLVGGIRVNGLEDIGAVLMVAQTAPVTWLNEHLGYFRLSPHQGTQQPMSRNFKRGALAWTAMAIGARRAGHLDADTTRASLAHSTGYVVRGYAGEADMQAFIELLPAVAQGDAAATEAFLALWTVFAD
jgi:hypothetical protein